VHSKWVGNVLRFFAGTAYPTLLDIDGDNGCIDAKALKINGTLVTATAAELNAIAGGGLSTAELGVLDGVTPGLSAVSKAVVLGATYKNIDEVHMAALYLGANAGTLVTATAANLNAIPTATGTGLEIDAQTKDIASSASTITLAAGGGVTQAAAVQLKDADGNNVAAVQHLRAYMATDAAGATPSAAGADVSVVVSGGATLKVQTAKLDWDVLTSAAGAVVFTFDNTGGGGAYADRLVVVLPNGKVLVSAALNVATA
jgi:hypothetical protein